LGRTYQAATEITSQANDVPMKAAAMLAFAIKEKTIANASKPIAPSAAPRRATEFDIGHAG
jgi:hypothetical protein